MADGEPRIIVDSDWKQEAQEEKERLARQAAAQARQPLPEASFLEIVNMVAMQAIIGLGGMKMPDGREMPPDPELARHNIDLLAVLQEKTAGCLNETEQRVLEATLHELRMGFVQTTTGGAETPSP